MALRGYGIFVVIKTEMKKLIFIVCALFFTSGCGKENKIIDSTIEKTGSMELEYATQYSVDYYEKGYVHIHINDGTDYILVPENEKDYNPGFENPIYIHRPCNSIYLAASSAMDLFLRIEALDSISACSTKSKDYAMEEVKKAIDSDEITYVGKYSAPDYELLLGKKCNLAVESTMISHSPKIKEQLESINIPVLVERSSYEDNPIGRLEWIKLYGVLTGKEEIANEYFEMQCEKLRSTVSDKSFEAGSHKKRVAFFSITSTGYVTVRKPGDYICRMIEMSGGEYALNELFVEEDNALSTINIGMEDFYREAHDADILIYNGSIDGGVSCMAELLEKNDILKEFDAVSEGNVWSTSLNMFQESSKIVDVIVEMANLISGNETTGGYLTHLE